jgi:predicted nucleic acid-binding protein
MIVVSDTSPINYLVLIGHGDLLHRLYGTILIPEAVRAELIHPRTPEPVRHWIQERQDVEVRAVTGPLPWEDLQRGEREAIALALELEADLILMDEKRGRRIAGEEGLIVVGILGILSAAAESGLISFPEAVVKLRTTSYRISEALVAALLDQHSP